LLAAGGVVLITLPNSASWQARRVAGCSFHLDPPRHRMHFTPTALERALRGRGAALEVSSLYVSSTSVGLPALVQYLLLGRCLVPTGFGLRHRLG
jgi:hypothetical protein